MILGIARSVLETTFLGSGFVFFVLVLLVATYEIQAALRQRKTHKKRARREHISVIVDGRQSNEAAVAATVRSVRSNRYDRSDIVIIAPSSAKLALDKNIRRYAPSTMTGQQLSVYEAYRRSRRGEYVVIVPAGVVLEAGALQTINRSLFFHTKSNKIYLPPQQIQPATLSQYYMFTVSAFRAMFRRALAITGIHYTRSTRLVAVRSSLVSKKARFVSTDILPSLVVAPARLRISVGGLLYSILGLLIIFDYLLNAQKIQLIALVIFIAVITIIAALLDTWASRHARRMLLAYAPSAFFVLIVAACSGLISMHRSDGDQLMRIRI